MASAINNSFPTVDNYVKREELSTGTLAIAASSVTANTATSGVGYSTGAGSAITQASFTLSGLAVVGTAGQCTVTAPATNLAVGQAIAVTGTLTGTLTGISTSTTYYIIATNGSTTMTLSASRGGAAITTTAGTSTGLIFTINGSSTRTTGLYVNTPTGTITLVSAAGSATAFSVTINNSSVAATDVVHVTQKTGTDAYSAVVSATAAGSFKLTITDLTGTTTEAPVFNFAVIKGVAA